MIVILGISQGAQDHQLTFSWKEICVSIVYDRVYSEASRAANIIPMRSRSDVPAVEVSFCDSGVKNQLK